MGNVTKSQQNNITSPNGNSLAVFVDGITGIMKVKDIMGNIQPLTDFVAGLGTNPFEYNANTNGIQPVLGTNDASGCYATIGGGCTNTASNYYATIGGGFLNTASNDYATIGGGSCNTASGLCSTIGGGNCNSASNLHSIVGGGRQNSASGCYSTVGGGRCNTASNCFATVGGGRQNTSSGGCSTVVGGCLNTASGNYSITSGGLCNISSGAYASAIVGGYCNIASCWYTFIGGGFKNTASNLVSVIGGGACNLSNGKGTTVSGGCCNTASNYVSVVGGGYRNNSNANYSGILGGKNNKICGFQNAMIIGSNLCATQSYTTFTNCLSANNLTVGCAVSVGANKVLVNATPKIGSFFSTQTQSATTINTPKAMTLNNTDAFSSGVSIVSNSQITVDTTGIYNLQFSAQIDRVTTSGVDRMEIWFRKQGVDIPNSTTKVTVSGSANQAKVVASWNFYVSLTAGQYVELMYSVTDLQVQIVTEAENLVVPYPATPSLIVTIQKIN
jgi:hypothetical protein